MRRQLLRIGIVASNVVFGWPLFTAIALQDLTSAHSAVIVGLLPAATALGAIGYAEGGSLARELGGRQVICWAVVLCCR